MDDIKKQREQFCLNVEKIVRNGIERGKFRDDLRPDIVVFGILRFDWEMTTVGDPLADVGAAMSYWIQADDSVLLKKGLGKPTITVMDGFYRSVCNEKWAKFKSY